MIMSESIEILCIDCGKEVYRTSKRCKSCARKGKLNPMFGVERKGENAPGYGRYHSKATKKLIGIASLGRMKGDKHYDWKGGITPLRIQIWKLIEYKQWRSNIFQRDNWTCQTCGDRSKKGNGFKLNAHHIKTFSLILKENGIKSIVEAQMCEELWDMDNGVTLCEDCHKLTDSYPKNLIKGS